MYSTVINIKKVELSKACKFGKNDEYSLIIGRGKSMVEPVHAGLP